jgi:uncharacterized protein
MRRTLVALILAPFLVAAWTSGAPASIRAMILDGESAGSYHDWRHVTPVLKKMLDETGLFEVTVTTASQSAGEVSGFNPEFTRFQVVVMNYDAPAERWSASLKSSFEQYVSSGGGVVLVHAANNAFAGWPAFNEMAGVGGWRDRTETAGPYWYYRGGQIVSDTTAGRAGSHGRRVPFQITVQDRTHPIMRDLPAVWMHQGDELYARLRGPGRNMTVLATAHSDPENAGSGRDEPQLMVVSFGRGRIFHTTLGHDINALSSVDFVVTFQRGSEWAASGTISQKAPSTFPSDTVVAYRADLAAMDPRYQNGLNGLDQPAPPRGK